MNLRSLEESFTYEDEIKIGQLRDRLKDIDFGYLSQDVYVGRWLKARNYHVEHAEKMFRTHLQWYKKFKIDELLKSYQPPEVIKRYFPGGVCGHDKCGRPVFYCPAGTADVIGLLKSATRQQLLYSQFYLMEWLMHCHFPNLAIRFSRPVDQLVVVFDMQSVNRHQFWQPWLGFIQEFIRIFELNYPEMLAVCYVVNVPSLFYLLFNLVKPLLSKDTQGKVHILGWNYVDELLKHIDPHQLPVYYGGLMSDAHGDSRCSSKICWGGHVPKYYYIRRPSHLCLSPLSIQRGGTEPVVVAENAFPGDVISWEFFTESHDIAFSLWMKQRDEIRTPVTTQLKRQTKLDKRLLSWTQVTPTTRVDCDLIPEIGMHKVCVAGDYCLVFDNTYSWTRNKKMWFRVEISLCTKPEIHPKTICKTIKSDTSILVNDQVGPRVTDNLDIDLSALMQVLVQAIPFIKKYSPEACKESALVISD